MEVTIAGDDLTRSFNEDQLGRVSIGLAAFDGEIGTGAIPLDDPTAADDYKGGRQVRIDEIAALLVDGFISDQDRQRGPVPITDREVVYGIQDPNALLFAKRAVRSRGSETDVARVLAFAALDLPGVDTAWVLNTFTSTMEAKKYEGEGWADLIQDTVNLTGKTTFIHDKAAGGRCLHYHRLTAGHTCGLTISDAAAQTATNYNPWNPKKRTSPADLGNDIMFVDQAGRTALYSDATSITNHDADGLAHQKIIRVEAASQTELNAIAASQGGETKDERFTWMCSIGPLDATALALIRVGDLITTTSQVMGLTAAVKRIAHMTLTPARSEGGGAIPGAWMAELELGAPVRRPFTKAKSKPKVSPASLPPTESWGGGTVLEVQTFADREANSKEVQRYTDTSPFTNDTVLGAVSVPTAQLFEETSGGIAEEQHHRSCLEHLAPAGATGARLTTRIGGPAVSPLVGTGTPAHFAIYRGTWAAATPSFSAFDPTPLVTGTFDYGEGSAGELAAELIPVDVEIPIDLAGRCQFVIAYDDTLQLQVNAFDSVGMASSIEDRVPGFPTGAGFSAEDAIWLQRADIPMPSMPLLAVNGDGTIYYHLTFYSGAAAPVPGQWVGPETVGLGDGVTTNYFTRFPYAAGSLRVYADNLREFDVAETDPPTGSFTFGSAPFSVETITVEYRSP